MQQFRDKKQTAKKKRIFRNSLFVAVFLILAGLGIFVYMSPVIYIVGKPIWKTKNFIGDKIDNAGYIFKTKSSVYRENENLIKTNEDLRLKMIDYNILEDENTKLKELYGRDNNSKNLILADILTKPNYSPYDTIIIDFGKNLGATIGAIVYSDTEIPIGIISEVENDTSLVTLYSSPGEVTKAMLDGSNANVDLVGRGGGNFEMTVPIDLSFDKGTVAFLPNLKSEVVAIIQDTISSPNDPVKRVLLNSPVNVQNLKWVFVEKK